MIDANNPGNLRPLPAPEVWKGQTCVVTQPNGEELAKFDTPIDGIRALGLNLLAYWSAGYQTCRTIAAHWAPSSDGNDPDAYAIGLSQSVDCSLDYPLPLIDADTLVELGKAVSIEENGHPAGLKPCWYSLDDWLDGMDEAIAYHFGTDAQPATPLPAPIPRKAPAPAISSDDGANALNEAELAKIEGKSV